MLDAIEQSELQEPSGVLNLCGDQLTASLADPFTFAQNAEFREILLAAKAETRPVSVLVLDVSRVTLIDSAGLGMLLIARDVAVSAGWSIVLAGARAQITRLLLLSRFDVLFKLKL